MRILGLSAHYHDSAAALLDDGRIVAAAQEERFSRRKHDASFPLQAARFCLERAGITADQLDAIAYYEKPFRKFDRLLTEMLREAPRGFARYHTALPLWLTSRLWVRSEVMRCLETGTSVHFLPHHESHAASAFGPSPFSDAAILTLDGVGEWTTNAVWHAREHVLTPLAELHYPHSLGLLYSAFTAYCGFRVNDGEYKLMGLAPYGQPTFAAAIRDQLIDLRPDGSYALNPAFFAYGYREAMTAEPFWSSFGGPPRPLGSPPGPREADLARSIQVVTEEVILRQARFARERTGASSLCLAGGVALNCVANGRLAAERIFDRLWIQPAAGDAGGALGAAFALWWRLAHPPRRERDADGQEGSLLGPEFPEPALEEALREAGLPYTRMTPEPLRVEVAQALANGECVGWFQGRMEFGPRALGNRSILADARDATMQSRLNRRIKERESFRPFAPMVRTEAAPAWFDLPAHSPYMLLTGSVRGATPVVAPAASLGQAGPLPAIASPIPAVTHVDGSARVQTLERGGNPPMEALLDAFASLTGCPVLLNTSFNGRDEPIVCTPRDAVACFLRTSLDRLVLGPFMARQPQTQPASPTPVADTASHPPRRWGLVLLELLVAAAGYGVLTRIAEAPRLAIAVVSMALALALLRLLAPGWRATVDGRFGTVGRWVARAVALPALLAVFAVAFVPAGVGFRLKRRLRGNAPPPATFWQPPAAPDHDPTLPY